MDILVGLVLKVLTKRPSSIFLENDDGLRMYEEKVFSEDNFAHRAIFSRRVNFAQ